MAHVGTLRPATRNPGSCGGPTGRRPAWTSRATRSWSSIRCLSSTWRCRSAFSIDSAAALAKKASSSASWVENADSRSLSTLRQPMTPVSLTIGTASSERVIVRPATYRGSPRTSFTRTVSPV